MSRVKGSPQRPMVVVPYRPVRKALLMILALVLAVGAAVGSYYLGYTQGESLQAGAVDERNRLRDQVARYSAEAEELRQQLANVRLGSEVDQQAGEELRTQVISLKEEVTSLEEDIAFYRGIMSPDDNRSGLTIGSLNVIGTGGSREYRYKLVVQQLATNHQVLNGHVNFNIVGREGDETVSLPLYRLSAAQDSENIRLRFRYFQNIEGRLTLPEGFEPERIEIVARSTGNNPQTVEERFGWLVQEQ